MAESNLMEQKKELKRALVKILDYISKQSDKLGIATLSIYDAAMIKKIAAEALDEWG